MELLVQNFTAANVKTALITSFKRLLGDDVTWKIPSKTYIQRVRRRIKHFDQIWQFVRMSRSVGVHFAHDASDIHGHRIFCVSGMLEDKEGNFLKSIISPGLIPASGSAVHEGESAVNNFCRGEEMVRDLEEVMKGRGLDPAEYGIVGRKLLKLLKSVISDNANGALAVSNFLKEALYAELPDAVKETWDEMSPQEQEKLTLLVLRCWAHLRHLQEKEGMEKLNKVRIACLFTLKLLITYYCTNEI